MSNATPDQLGASADPDIQRSNHAKLMATIRQLASIANLASVPVGLGAHVLMDDKGERDDLLNIISSGLTAINAPIAADTARQAIQSAKTYDEHGRRPAPTAVALEAAPDIMLRTLPVLEMLIRQAL